jgi:hypothetical protein
MDFCISGEYVMSKKLFFLFSCGIMIWSTGKLYVTYTYFVHISQMHQKYQQSLGNVKKPREINWDGSELVRLLLYHAQAQSFIVHKIEPQFSNQFNVVMEGSYMHFVSWIASIYEEKPQIHWLKITIRKVASDKQRYILYGAYSG